MVVVLPTPLTPTNSHTGTRPASADVVTDRSDVSDSSNASCTARATPSGAPLDRSVSSNAAVVTTPTSLRSKTSSTTPSCSSLRVPTLVMERTRSKILRDEARRCASAGVVSSASVGRWDCVATKTSGIAARVRATIWRGPRRRRRATSNPIPASTTTPTTMSAMITRSRRSRRV